MMLSAREEVALRLLATTFEKTIDLTNGQLLNDNFPSINQVLEIDNAISNAFLVADRFFGAVRLAKCPPLEGGECTKCGLSEYACGCPAEAR